MLAEQLQHVTVKNAAFKKDQLKPAHLCCFNVWVSAWYNFMLQIDVFLLMISIFQIAAVTCVNTEINNPVRPALIAERLECYESILVIDN